ncbi:cupredoxin domain-containing protein [Nakamurella lactea]|uniref:hypothetical protein n=1 Tax=Nakamurella lactea TaxID=459515 RepID=UPI00048E7F42|nr:hypothetical protein [Nakamurella lactea]
MELPSYWLRRPNSPRHLPSEEAMDRLLDRILASPGGGPIDYQLDVPKWRFLQHAVDREGLVLHGSSDPALTMLEPRQPSDPLEFSDRNAVFAAADGIWPLYFAVVDRARHRMRLLNAAIRVLSPAGPSDPYYLFSISAGALAQRPWRTGTVYLLPGETFEPQPPIDAGGRRVQVLQSASPAPVRPIAALSVDPTDFPFLHQIRGHDDEVLGARIAADPTGFPWLQHGDE